MIRSGSYLSPAFTKDDIRACSGQISFTELSDAELPERSPISSRRKSHRLVYGRMEFGLGIADVPSSVTRNRKNAGGDNLKIKFRAPPVCSSVLRKRPRVV
jgi:hypothetical protein